MEKLILQCFPKDPWETITWSELWGEVQRAKHHRVGSKQTLAKYLKQFLQMGLVVQEGKGYRLSSTIRVWTNRERELPLEWQGKSIQDKVAFRRLLALQFTFILASYMEMLDGLIEIQEKSKALEYVHSFFRIVPPEDQLTLFATEVWRNRKTVPLKALENEAIEKKGTLSFELKVGPSLPYEL